MSIPGWQNSSCGWWCCALVSILWLLFLGGCQLLDEVRPRKITAIPNHSETVLRGGGVRQGETCGAQTTDIVILRDAVHIDLDGKYINKYRHSCTHI